jgi:nicotinamidase/pyrazinamidase
MFNTAEPSRELFFEYWKVQGVTEVEVVGVAADVCVNQAVHGLKNRGFNVTVRNEMTKGIFRQMNQVVEEEHKGEIKLV